MNQPFTLERTSRGEYMTVVINSRVVMSAMITATGITLYQHDRTTNKRQTKCEHFKTGLCRLSTYPISMEHKAWTLYNSFGLQALANYLREVAYIPLKTDTTPKDSTPEA